MRCYQNGLVSLSKIRFDFFIFGLLSFAVGFFQVVPYYFFIVCAISILDLSDDSLLFGLDLTILPDFEYCLFILLALVAARIVVVALSQRSLHDLIHSLCVFLGNKALQQNLQRGDDKIRMVEIATLSNNLAANVIRPLSLLLSSSVALLVPMALVIAEFGLLKVLFLAVTLFLVGFLAFNYFLDPGAKPGEINANWIGLSRDLDQSILDLVQIGGGPIFNKWVKLDFHLRRIQTLINLGPLLIFASIEGLVFILITAFLFISHSTGSLQIEMVDDLYASILIGLRAVGVVNNVMSSSLKVFGGRSFILRFLRLLTDQSAPQNFEVEIQNGGHGIPLPKSQNFTQYDKVYAKEMIDSGSMVRISGKSGVGKTTFCVKWVNTLRQSGVDALFFGAESTVLSLPLVQFVTWQETLDISAYRELFELLSMLEIHKIFNELDLDDLDSTQIDWSTQAYSDGEVTRLVLARALWSRPKLLIIDELLARLDVQSERVVLKAIKQWSPDTVFVSISHRDSNSDLFDNHLDFKGV